MAGRMIEMELGGCACAEVLHPSASLFFFFFFAASVPRSNRIRLLESVRAAGPHCAATEDTQAL